MSSSYGTDASKTALEARYNAVMPALPTSFAQAGGAGAKDALETLKSTELWARANVVLLPARGCDAVDMTRVASEALVAGKRVGLAVLAGEFGGSDEDATVDFIEVMNLDEVATPPTNRVPSQSYGRSEGDTITFACDELLDSICVVPGLVFDARGYRVGSDKGAYDRFLAFYPGHKIALVSSMQIGNNPLPRAAGEVPVDYLMSEVGVWRCF